MMKKIKECNNYIKKIAAFFILMIIIFNSGCAGTKFNSYSKKVIYPSTVILVVISTSVNIQKLSVRLQLLRC